jgi:hypothetical protein
MKPSPSTNDDLIERTRRLWGSRLARDVNYEAARQIFEDVTGFFAVLADWLSDERATNDNGAPSESKDRQVRHES